MDTPAASDMVESSQETSQTIQAINRDAVHRICSGQVVLSLAIAVKELVENSIDAGATIIDIRLKEYGSELIEVVDNGRGVSEEDFQALSKRHKGYTCGKKEYCPRRTLIDLQNTVIPFTQDYSFHFVFKYGIFNRIISTMFAALKHYTSKIKQFSDLEHIATLGFRGEALSSLCALSDLTVLTKHQDVELATKITYDRNGKIVNQVPGAREQGTTVTLENLFSMLPVRRKEFMKNLKREFNKMCQLLYAYCLVSKCIKFSCTNTTNKGSRNSVVATDGLSTVRENIINVFGPKQISSLIDVEIVKPEEPILNEYGLKLAEGESLPFTFEFLISSVTHGCGRSTNDRQFFYVNSRPCEPTKIMKLVNEIYRQYNAGQHPFVYLNVTSKSCLVDVNVTPDKRQVFLEKEKVLLATLKASLLEAFKSFPSTFKLQNLDVSSQNSPLITSFYEHTVTAKEDNRESGRKSLKRSATEGSVRRGSILERFQKRSKTDTDMDSSRDKSVEAFSLNSPASTTMELDKSNPPENENDVKMENFVKVACRLTQHIKNGEKIASLGKISTKEKTSPVKQTETKKRLDLDISGITKLSEDSDLGSPIKRDNTIIKTEDLSMKSDEKDSQNSFKSESDSPNTDEDVVICLDSSPKVPLNRRSLTLNVSLDDIKESLRKKSDRKRKTDQIKVRFRSKIAPDNNKTAEEELQRQISKSDFKEMRVLGQFNLGFVITKLNSDLFIVDQHASDEKYNFEDLQANTVLEKQVLVNPKKLELTAGQESILIENEEIFRKNGFTFKIDHSAPCTKKVALTSIPMSKNFVFGKDDIDEMLFMLQETNNQTCRPSRVRTMFASRACRKSVMIGKALSKADMRKLIDHMGEIDQPWNCPHGRPTMRHLINLDLIEEDRDLT